MVQLARNNRLPLLLKLATIVVVLVIFVYKLNNTNNAIVINKQLDIVYVQREDQPQPQQQQQQVVKEQLQGKYEAISENIIEITTANNPILPTIATTRNPIDEIIRNRQQLLKCQNRPLEMEIVQHGKYWMIKNYIRGIVSSNIGCAESITYTTHGDYTFFENLPLLVTRWLAPISFAVFAPGDDMTETIASIHYVRNCLTESELIRKYVTFHIYFPNNHMPENIPTSESEAMNLYYDCEVEVAPYENVTRKEMYKFRENLTYPINVGRNIARKAANTYFIFACDIELYPNLGFVDKFLDLVDRNSEAILGGEKPRVFPIPLFEIEKNASIPETKAELLGMLKSKMAIPFHARVCLNCHFVPNQTEWLNATDAEEINVFAMGKRYGKFKYWEPFYISDNREPLFDERVTWEGQSNKRIQNYAMCLLDYEYHILHPPFLIHSPGIKILNRTSDRFNYVRVMNKIIRKTIVPEYLVLYGNNTKCIV